MIRLIDISLHKSSPASFIGDETALATRTDLFTEDSFYFGFDSSNQNFADILYSENPLCIKFNHTLTMYRESKNSGEMTVYYLDAARQALIPLLSCKATKDELPKLRALCPFNFATTEFTFEPADTKPKSLQAALDSLEAIMRNPETQANDKSLHESREQIRQKVSAIPMIVTYPETEQEPYNNFSI